MSHVTQGSPGGMRTVGKHERPTTRLRVSFVDTPRQVILYSSKQVKAFGSKFAMRQEEAFGALSGCQ